MKYCSWIHFPEKFEQKPLSIGWLTEVDIINIVGINRRKSVHRTNKTTRLKRNEVCAEQKKDEGKTECVICNNYIFKLMI